MNVKENVIVWRRGEEEYLLYVDPVDPLDPGSTQSFSYSDSFNVDARGYKTLTTTKQKQK